MIAKQKTKVLLKLSDSDLALPRSERQFPFRFPGPGQCRPGRDLIEFLEIQIAIGETLRGVTNMIYAAAVKAARKLGRGRDRALVEDFAQQISLHVAQHCLPRFDRLRGYKVSTFVCACSAMYAAQLARRTYRRQSFQRPTEPLTDIHHAPTKYNPATLVSDEEEYDAILARIMSQAGPILQTAIPRLIAGEKASEISLSLGLPRTRVMRELTTLAQKLGIDRRRDIQKLDECGRVVGVFTSALAAGRANGITGDQISRVLGGQRHSAGGFRWRYARSGGQPCTPAVQNNVRKGSN